jgi:small subunit ribosomal protein S3
VKVWLYKGDILPYKTTNDDKATLEAAMAAGETSGQSKPRKVVSSSAAARKKVATPETETETDEEEPAPLIKEADPEFEKLLDEEDAIEASTREQSETPHFRAND